MQTDMDKANSMQKATETGGSFMKTIMTGIGIIAMAVFAMQPAKAQVAVEGEKIYTMAGDPIENGVVLINGGQIEQVGPATEVDIPAGYDTHSAEVVTPGLIDGRSVVGLNGIYNVSDDQDALEGSQPIQPELRAFDAYDPNEQLVDFLRNKGITTVHTGHAPGNLVSGQTMIVKTEGNTVGDAIIDSVKTVAMTLGPRASNTRAKGASQLRQELIRAQEHAESRRENGPSSNIGREIMADIIDGEINIMITAQRATEIITALRIADEFDLTDNLILDGVAEAHMVMDEIREAGVPVFVHPTMVSLGGTTENASYETASKLEEAGVPFTFQSGFEGYVPKTRVVHYEAGIAAANGLDRTRALERLTIDAARVLGIDDRVGSLEAGKDADLALFEGDPLEYTTQTCTVIIDGNVVSDECH